MTRKAAGKKKQEIVVTNHTKRNRKKPVSRVLLRVSGGNVRTSWLTLQVPTWLVLATLIFILLLILAITLSPDIAAKFAYAIIQLARLFLPPTK